MFGLDAGLGIGLFLIFLLFFLAILGFAFWLWMLIDAINRQFVRSEDKIVWIIILIFTNDLGAAIYYFVVKRHG